MRFRRPLSLPGRALLSWDRDGAQGRFALQSPDGGTLHLYGRYETA